MRISQPKQVLKNVGKGYLFQRVILARTFEWRGTLAFCDSIVPPPPIGPSYRGTQIILISSNLWNASLWEFCCFFEPNYEKSVWNGYAKITFSRWFPIQREILGGALEWKGTLWVPPQPGCPRVCPPWAHRSYATGAVQQFYLMVWYSHMVDRASFDHKHSTVLERILILS